jgi:hypothetical protein
MRMTLSEALKDDLDTIKDGVFCVLPIKDSSGRQLLHLEPGRKSDGVPTDSLVRYRFSNNWLHSLRFVSVSHTDSFPLSNSCAHFGILRRSCRKTIPISQVVL